MKSTKKFYILLISVIALSSVLTLCVFMLAACDANRPGKYGKFSFTRVPDEGRLDDTVNANCFAYAVRDIVPVYLHDLGSNYREVNRVLSESGEDGVADYIGELFEKYVEEHKAALRVSKLR